MDSFFILYLIGMLVAYIVTLIDMYIDNQEFDMETFIFASFPSIISWIFVFIIVGNWISRLVHYIYHKFIIKI